MNVEGLDFSEERWSPYLSERRKKEASERKQEKDRRLFLGAELLLNRSLELLWPDMALPAEYGRNKYGKPYLCPPYENIYVSWSHSGKYVLCAMADREVGVDLQEMRKEPGEKLASHVLRGAELEFYESQEPRQKKRLFYQYWVLKESFLKALGTGFQTPLTDFFVEMGERGAEISQKVNEKKYQCRILDFEDENYAAAICCEGEEPLERVEIKYL